jgi:hypothetical protein
MGNICGGKDRVAEDFRPSSPGEDLHQSRTRFVLFSPSSSSSFSCNFSCDPSNSWILRMGRPILVEKTFLASAQFVLWKFHPAVRLAEDTCFV